MIHMKVKGLFQTLPLESLTLERICSLTDSSIEEVQPVLDQLREEKFIVGKRKMKLKNVPEWVTSIPKQKK